MPVSLRFRPPWWAVALAVAGCAAGIALGNWQSGRAEEKRALAAAMKPESLRGQFLSERTIFLSNRPYHGQFGYYVVQPLRLADGHHVLVNRGWIAAGSGKPQVVTPPGEVSVQGLRQERLPRAYEPPGALPRGQVRSNVTLDEFATWSGLALEPWVLEQHSALDDGLTRDWPRADGGVAMHESYALQWYSLSALSVVLLVALNVRRHDAAAG